MRYRRATSKPGPTKIAYLFGAGATHAELTNLDPTIEEKQEKLGLLIKHVSARVIENASHDPVYRKDLKTVSAASGFPNIELLISLIENSKIHDWDNKTRILKQLVKEDIQTILTKSKTKRFYLHKALIELHKHKVTRAKEQLIGFISLNYDDVLDQAYEKCHGTPNYCFRLDSKASSTEDIPLLKLHGSFTWSKVKIGGRTRNIEIIPLGSNKNYLHPPYSFIWNRSMEVLIECDILRVIGCSLSSNDAHLIDLLFKAQLERGKAFDLELIDFPVTGEQIQKNYGFFAGVKRLTEIEPPLIPEPNPANPFKTWLKYKILDIFKGRMIRQKHLKSVIS